MRRPFNAFWHWFMVLFSSYLFVSAHETMVLWFYVLLPFCFCPSDHSPMVYELEDVLALPSQCLGPNLGMHIKCRHMTYVYIYLLNNHVILHTNFLVEIT